jgi:hypothetical protein
MKYTPPIVSEAEADATYNAACAWMFGTTEPRPVSPVTAGLKRQIAALQTSILQRHTAKTVIAENLAPTYSPTDIRHPQHHQHREFQKLRKKIVHALENKKMIRLALAGKCVGLGASGFPILLDDSLPDARL